MKDQKLYIGSTSNIKRRLQEHNTKQVSSTKSRVPFKLVYLEGYINEQEARHREHNLKLGARALKQLTKRIEKSIAS